jgi:hypothetical protein
VWESMAFVQNSEEDEFRQMTGQGWPCTPSHSLEKGP